jgi:hypothetical protein
VLGFGEFTVIILVVFLEDFLGDRALGMLRFILGGGEATGADEGSEHDQLSGFHRGLLLVVARPSGALIFA